MARTNKRLEMMRREKNPASQDTTIQRAPSDPAGITDQTKQAKLTVQLRAKQLQEALNDAGMAMDDALNLLGVSGSKPIEINIPVINDAGETVIERYETVTTYLDYETLKDKCKIDPANTRGPDERTEEALADIIDEIGIGFQVLPIIAYIDDDGLISIEEGSRRHASAMFRKVGLRAEIFDRKPSKEAILRTVESSNKRVTFTDLSLGEIYDKLIEQWGCTAKEFAERKGISEQMVSLRLNFYRAPQELKALLATTSTTTTQRESAAFVTSTRFITEHNLTEEAVKFVSIKISETEGSPESLKKATIEALKNFVDEKKRKTVARDNKPREEVLYEKGTSKVKWSQTKGVSKINLQRLPVEWQDEIKELVANYLKSK